MTDEIQQSSEDPNDIETVAVGFYRYREARGTPWQPLRIMRESGLWIVIKCGHVMLNPTARAKDNPFLLWRSPFHKISEAEYYRLIAAYENAPAGHPLRTPEKPVDLRAAPSLSRGQQ